jgi:hypothetical protein
MAELAQFGPIQYFEHLSLRDVVLGDVLDIPIRIVIQVPDHVQECHRVSPSLVI